MFPPLPDRVSGRHPRPAGPCPLLILLVTSILLGHRACAEVPPGCDANMDVVFVVDSSESVLEHDPIDQPLYHWGQLQDLLHRVLSSLPIPLYTQAALLAYSQDIDFQLGLGHHSYQSLQQTVMDLTPRRKATNTAGALQYVRHHMFNGARAGSRKVVVVFTDGLSNWQSGLVVDQARALHAITDQVHAVAITPYIDELEMRQLASADGNFLQVHLDLLEYYADTLVTRLCKLPEPEPPLLTPPNCDLRADIALLADNSGSIRDKNPCDTCDNYLYLKEFLVSLVRGVNVQMEYSRVAAVRFSSDAYLEFYLDEYSTQAQVEDAIMDMPYAGSYTNIAHAIQIANDQVFRPERGDRPDVRNVAILVTDGESNVNQSFTLYEADLAKARGINFFVVGFTNAINTLELQSIASEPVSGHFFATADALSLHQLQEELVRLICSTSPLPRVKRSVPSHHECTNGGDNCRRNNGESLHGRQILLLNIVILAMVAVLRVLA